MMMDVTATRGAAGDFLVFYEDAILLGVVP